MDLFIHVFERDRNTDTDEGMGAAMEYNTNEKTSTRLCFLTNARSGARISTILLNIQSQTLILIEGTKKIINLDFV